jgi:hypothetical protein
MSVFCEARIVPIEVGAVKANHRCRPLRTNIRSRPSRTLSVNFKPRIAFPKQVVAHLYPRCAPYKGCQ